MPSTPSTCGRHTDQGTRNSITPAPANPLNHQPKPPGPTVAGYLDRITIAGLHNYLYATDWYEKVVWILTFLVAIVGTMFYLVPTIQQYLEYTIVLEIQHQIEPGLVLPPVWVCTPGINHSFIDDQFDIVRSKLLANKRRKLLVKRFQDRWTRTHPIGPMYYKMDPKTGIFTEEPSIWNSKLGIWEQPPDTNPDWFIMKLKAFATFSQVYDGTYDVDVSPQVLNEMLMISIELGWNWQGYKAYYEQGMFQCRSIVKNCSLNGIPFDCCRADSVGRVRGDSKCFKVDLPTEAAALKLHPSETSKFELSIETIIDSTYLGIFGRSEATMSDISFGNRMGSLFEMFLPMGSGSISTITVRGIKKIEQSNCTDKFRPIPWLHVGSHPIIRDYFEELSKPNEYSVGACEVAKLFEALYIQCGCVLYYDTMRPQNDSVICRPQHINVCFFGAFQEKITTAVASSPTNSSAMSPEDQAKQDVIGRVKQDVSKECLPLCESWTYDFVSTSTDAAGGAFDIHDIFAQKRSSSSSPNIESKRKCTKWTITH